MSNNSQIKFNSIDNYIIYLLFYKINLFNSLNSVNYKSCIKNYVLIGLDYMNLNNYFIDFTSNISYIKYIRKYYENILYIFVINYYLKTNKIFDSNNLNLLLLYNIIKEEVITVDEKKIKGIKVEDIFEVLKKKLGKAFKAIEKIKKETRGGADETVNENAINKLNKVELTENSPFSYFIHIDLDLYPGNLTDTQTLSTIKKLYLSCNNTKENIKKNIADITNVPYNQSAFTSSQLLSMDPSFPVDKFLPNEAKQFQDKQKKEEEKQKKKDEKQKLKEEKKEEKRRKKEEKIKGGAINDITQIANPFTIYPSFLNEYLK